MGAEETWPRPSSEREGNMYHLPVLVCFVRPLQGKAKKNCKSSRTTASQRRRCWGFVTRSCPKNVRGAGAESRDHENDAMTSTTELFKKPHLLEMDL